MHILITRFTLNEKGTDDIEEEAIPKRSVGSKKGNNCNWLLQLGNLRLSPTSCPDCVVGVVGLSLERQPRLYIYLTHWVIC